MIQTRCSSLATPVSRYTESELQETVFDLAQRVKAIERELHQVRDGSEVPYHNPPAKGDA
jgi:hypothetical protein